MRSALEQTLTDKKAQAEAVIAEEHGDDALDALYNFSDLDCIIDLKSEKEGWIRYVFIEGDEDGGSDSLRRIA